MVTYRCILLAHIVSICIQCVWAMGGVKDVHLKYELSVDQYVGQFATSKDQLSKMFSPSPDYFYSSRIDELYQGFSMKSHKVLDLL